LRPALNLKDRVPVLMSHINRVAQLYLQELTAKWIKGSISWDIRSLLSFRRLHGIMRAIWKVTFI
jgi:hypothetical protein